MAKLRQGLNEIRKIIHVDMDAFYASVEQLYSFILKGNSFAQGSSSEIGVVTIARNETYEFAESSAISYSRC